MNLGLAGKIVVVTGGSRGLGAAIVDAFEDEGATVVVLSRTYPPLGAWKITDVMDDRSVEDAFRDMGRVDILVNNVGGHHPDAMAFNFGTARRVSKYAMPLIPADGSIVNIASICGLGYPGPADYVAAKAAVIGLTKSMSRAAAPIRVNCVAPGSIRHAPRNGAPHDLARYEQVCREIPLGRMGDPEEVARVVVFLASPACSWVTGSCWVVDGGRMERI